MPYRKRFGIIQFFERYPNEEACLRHIFDQRLGNHSPCPNCGVLGKWIRIKGTKKWQHTCRKQISPLNGTLFYRSNVSLMAWFYALFLFANSSISVRAGFIRRQLGLGHNSSYRMCRSIRIHMAAMPRPDMLGGEGKSVHIDKVHLRYITRKGGGAYESALVLGIACEGQVLCGIVPDRTSNTLIPQILARVRPGSKIVTDMLSSYHALHRYGFEHVRINHSVAFHDFNGHTNNEIEAFWATVRRMLRAARQVSRENLWTFLAETEFHYNRRHAKHLIF